MSSKYIYHYVYRITNTIENKHYYGKRSSKCDPKEDLGKKYFSSSTDEEFILDQKLNPQNYRYKIVQRFEDGKSAILRESKLHHKFNVSNSLKFYNKVKQNPNGYDLTDIEFSKEIRAKMSIAAKNRKITEETRRKLSECHKGRICTQETREKIAKPQRGRKQSQELLDKLSKARKGLKRSPETKARMSASGSYRGKNNSFFLRYYKTPAGIFDSPSDMKILGILKTWCMKPDKLIHNLSYTKCHYLNKNFTWDFICGKTFGEI